MEALSLNDYELADELIDDRDPSELADAWRRLESMSTEELALVREALAVTSTSQAQDDEASLNHLI